MPSSFRTSVKLILLFFFFTTCLSLNGQSYLFKNYKNFGFSSNQIFAIHQDQNGFLWFGTGVGLTRYDSNRFITFSVNDGLPANEILALESVADSMLWIGTGLGLSAFSIKNPNDPDFIFTPVELSSFSISSLLYSNNALWIGTRRNGLFLLQYKNIDDYTIQEIIPAASVKDIKPTMDGQIAVLDNSSVIFINSSGLIENQVAVNSENRLKCLIEKEPGIFWVGTESGLLEINIPDNTTEPAKLTGSSKYDYNRLIRQPNNTIWGGSGKGLLKFFNNHVELIDRSNGLPGSDLRALLFDSEGNLWLGSYINGLSKMNNTTLVNFSESNGLLSNVVNCILSETRDQKLIGTDLGIFKINNFSLNRDERFTELNNNIIWFIYRSHNNDIWIGGEDILYRFNHNSLKEIKIPLIRSECTFLDMLQSRDGTRWFCTTIGLFSLKNGKYKDYPIFKEHGIRSIWEVEQLENGRLLFGTDNGIAELINGSFKFSGKENGLPDRAVYSIHQDQIGRVWLGSDLGVILEQKDGYRLFGRQDGLQGTIISQIMSDALGGLWICSDRGLQKFTPDGPVERYGIKDGLLGEEFTTQNSSLIDEKGNFWLGVFGGLSVFNPNQPGGHGGIPKMYFSRANYIDNNVQVSFLNFENARIDYDNRNVSFQLTGLYYYNESDLSFYYRLLGLEEDWQEAARNDIIRYSSIDPGTYNFQVKAVVDGKSVEGSFVSKQFVILKPFWQKGWFIFITIAAILLAAYGFFHYKTRRILTENKKLQDEINKNIEDLSVAKATIENIIEHSGSILVTTDLKGRIVTWNRRAEEVFGYSKDQILHKNIKSLDQENDLWNFPEILKEVRKSGELRQLEIKKVTADGSLIDLIVTATALSDKDGKYKLINISMEDFSERNRLTELRINREKLLAGIEALNKLLATLSHYINNSIASISGMAQLVELDESYNKKFLSVTNIQIKKIQAVLNSLSILVNQLNLKTRDYVGEQDTLFDIENEIEQFISSVQSLSGKK